MTFAVVTGLILLGGIGWLFTFIGQTLGYRKGKRDGWKECMEYTRDRARR